MHNKVVNLMYKAIIFDFGNTLAGSASLIDSLIPILENEKANIVGTQIENEIRSLYKPDQRLQPDWKGIWERCFNQSGLSFNEEVGRRHLEEFCRLNKTFPQVIDLLSELKQNGFKLGLLSNVTGPHDIFQKDLDARGLSKYFDSVIWSSEVGYRKPSSKVFEIILAELSVKPKDALMVGDSEIADIGGASNIGMDAVLVSLEGNLKTKAKYQAASSRMFNDVIAIISIGTRLVSSRGL